MNLAGLLKGTVTLPGDPGWEQQRFGWNLAVDQRPSAVVEVTGVDDIVAAVRYAAEHGHSVSAQTRGHGATTAVDGAILLRAGALDELTVDVSGRVARVGPGVRWQQLNEALSVTGLTALPGSSGDPTVVALTVGGGLSWFGRTHGLGSGRIRAAELVDAGGNHRRVTEQRDPDLFWALCGAGGDFGIVTALELELLPLGPLYGGRLLWPVEHATAVLGTFAELSEVAPDRLTLWAWLLNLPDPENPAAPPQRAVAVDLTCLGDAEDAEALIAPLRAVAPPVTDTLAPLSLAQLGEIAAEPVDPTPVADDATLLNRFDAGAVHDLVAAVTAGDASALQVVQVRRLGGGFTRPVPGAASTLDQPYLLVGVGLVMHPDLAAPMRAAIDALRTAMRDHDSGRAPYNFGRHAELVYPPDVLQRLRQVKRQVDPDGVIRSNRPIDGQTRWG
jgi:FAD/FMN-containing dehydrogenase